MRSVKITNKPYKEDIPSWCIFVDTETKANSIDDGEELTLLLGCYEVWVVDDMGLPIGMHAKGTFFTSDEFYNLIAQYIPARVIAHNWNFDAAVLQLGALTNMIKHEYNINVDKSIIPVDNQGYTPFLISLEFESGITELICNTNFYKQSLADIGMSFGYHKLTMPDVDAIDDMITYCQRDVEILRMAWFYLFEFIDDIAGTTPGVTLAMAANRVYRKRFMPDEIIQGTLSIDYINQAELIAYKGGRTDAFYSGTPKTTNVFKYDVNSLYPSVMLDDIPIRYMQKVSTEQLLNELQSGDTRFIYLADITINISPEAPLAFIGAEGIKNNEGQLVFPIGKYRTWVWLPMIEILFEQGYIETVHTVLAYTKAPIFNDYVTTLYEDRKKYKISGDKARDLLLKLMLNSLYGKFGQREHGKWIQVNDDEYEYVIMHRKSEGIDRFQDFYDDEYNSYLSVGDSLYKGNETKGNPTKNSVLSIAGYITTKARAVLWRGLAGIIEAGGEVYYCDTDSIFSSIELPTDLVSDFELGKWKLEDTFKASETVFTAPKHYMARDKWTIKGIRNPTNASEFTQNVFPNFLTDLSSSNSKRRKNLDNKPIIKQITKTPTGDNKKRVYQGDNLPTLPLVVSGVDNV